MTADVRTSRKKEILLITYEFTFQTFSGNGILARSLVKSLLHHGCTVTVWCCRPPDDGTCSTNGQDHHIKSPELDPSQMERLDLIPTTLSSGDKWHRLDDGSAWNEFSWDQLPESSQKSLEKAAKNAKAVLVIDWTGHHAWESTPFSSSKQQSSSPPPPLVYMNFRVFSSGVSDPEKRAWYDAREKLATMKADLVVTLSEKDKASLVDMMMMNNKDDANTNTSSSKKDIRILVPPLRGDIEELALQHARTDTPTSLFLEYMPPEVLQAMGPTLQPRKCLITCIVRLSPEKNTRRFVRFLQATRDFWKAQNWIPLLAGSSSDPDYAKIVKSEMEQVCGGKGHCVILDSFLPQASLVAVLSCAVVNFHPCAYDAYGMTVMEAGAMGVPSIIASGGHVGASVHVGNGGSIEVEMSNDSSESMSDEAISKALETLRDPERLSLIGQEAQRRAIAWDEDAYGKTLLDFLAGLSSQ